MAETAPSFGTSGTEPTMDHTHVREISAADFESEVVGSKLPVVVDFYSTECPPCEALAPKFAELAGLYGEHVQFVKIFRQGNRDLADELNVRSSPTLLFLNQGHEVAPRLSGAIRRSAMASTLEHMIDPDAARTIVARQKRTSTEADLLVLGGGPAGLTAGIYAAQAKLRVIVVDAGLGGGNLAITHQISNFPGFPQPQPGYMLAHLMVEHAKAAGVEMRLAADVSDVDLERRSLVVDGLETIVGKKLLIATGSSPRPIGVKGERDFKGKGISYCATCDAKYYDGKHVVVIGGGNSAIEEALFITRFASRITIVHQFAELQANRVAQQQAFAHPKIEFLFEHEPREFVHDGRTVSTVDVENLKTHERKLVACDGVFIFAGMRPNLDALPVRLEQDDFGYLKVDDEMRTSVSHVFAAGDIVSKRYRQMTTAIADGTIAAIAAARELAV
jgi:thioredoxin reductase (NADPH)